MEYNSHKMNSNNFYDFYENSQMVLHTTQLQDLAVPQHQVYAPLTPHAQASQNELTQSQVSVLQPPNRGPGLCAFLTLQGPVSPENPTEKKDMDLEYLFEELMEIPSWHEHMNRFAQSNSTATFQMTQDTDMLTSVTGVQTRPVTPVMPVSDPTTSGSQTTLNLMQSQQDISSAGFQKINRRAIPFHCNQPLNGNWLASPSSQNCWMNQMPFTGDKIGNWSQASFNKDQNQSGRQMVFPELQTINMTQMPLSEGQSLSDNKMPFPGSQTVWGGQDTFSENQTLNGNPIFPGGHQTSDEGQMTSLAGLYAVNFVTEQTFPGPQLVTQRGTPTLSMIQMMPQVLASPQGGFVDSSAQFDQGHLLAQKPQKPKMTTRRMYQKDADGRKYYECTFQGCVKVYYKASHLRIHERIHTGKCLTCIPSIIITHTRLLLPIYKPGSPVALEKLAILERKSHDPGPIVARRTLAVVFCGVNCGCGIE